MTIVARGEGGFLGFEVKFMTGESLCGCRYSW